jgi:hypothetical protein
METDWVRVSRYFDNRVHCFDALVVIISFVADVVMRETVGKFAAVVVSLRLWRFVNVVVAGRVDGLGGRGKELERRVMEVVRRAREADQRLADLERRVLDHLGHWGWEIRDDGESIPCFKLADPSA